MDGWEYALTKILWPWLASFAAPIFGQLFPLVHEIRIDSRGIHGSD
jgi:hypothetical protein